MKKEKIDLSDIKENELDKTSTFTDLMSRKERKKRKQSKEETLEQTNNIDIEEMLEEKRKNTKDLTDELNKAKKEYSKSINDEESLSKTQILELTRQMKFNLNETREKNTSKKGISKLNIIGEVSLLCIGYYIYILLFTNYQDTSINYMINGGIIVLLVLLFGLSVVTRNKVSKAFNILNILAIIGFIIFNIYTLI